MAPLEPICGVPWWRSPPELGGGAVGAAMVLPELIPPRGSSNFLRENPPMTPIEAKQFLADHQVKFILAQFVDIHGTAKTKAVPACHFEDILNPGAGFAGFAVWGLGQQPHSHDFMAVGDPATLSLVPWMPGFARIVCVGHVDGQPYPYDARFVLMQQLAQLKQRGWTLNTGLEPEFVLLQRDAQGRSFSCRHYGHLRKALLRL